MKGKLYDLLCTPTSGSPSGTPPVHAEVKGSLGDARVDLTRNEVEHARDSNGWRTDLYIMSHVELVRNADAQWVASRGRARCIEGWTPHEEDLDATRFDYRVPV